MRFCIRNVPEKQISAANNLLTENGLTGMIII